MYARDMSPDHALHEHLSCAETIQQVRWADLPLACPMPDTSLWNAHQRVYLPIEFSGREICPYCSTVYVLSDPVPGEPAPQFANAQIEKLYWKAMEQRVRDGSAS